MQRRPRTHRPAAAPGRVAPVSGAGLRAALWAGFLGGCLAGFTKWGTEAVLPSRRPGRPIPPVEVLKSLGLDADAMTYRYAGRTLNYGAAGAHQAFSIAFGMLYAALAEEYPGVTRGHGTAFGLAVTVLFHGGVLPAGGWAPPLWEVPADEVASETLGHLLWIWTIELVRRDMLGRDADRPRPRGT